MNPNAKMRSCWWMCAVLLAGCGAVRFDVSENIDEQKITGNPLSGLLPSFIPNPFRLNIDLKEETQKRDTGPATAVYLKSISFTASRDAGTFDFMDTVYISVGASGLDTKEIAELNPVPSGKTSLEVDVMANQNLIDYVKTGATITATATGRQPRSDFYYTGIVVLEVRI